MLAKEIRWWSQFQSSNRYKDTHSGGLVYQSQEQPHTQNGGVDSWAKREHGSSKRIKKSARFFSNHISCGRWVESIFYSSRDMNRLFFLFHSIPTICLKQRHLPFEFQSWNQTFWVVRSIVRFHSSKSKQVGKHVCSWIQTCFGWGWIQNMGAAEFE